MLLKIMKTAVVYFAILISKTPASSSAQVSINMFDAINKTDFFPDCTNTSLNDWCNKEWGPTQNYSTPLTSAGLIDCYKDQNCPIIDFAALIIGELIMGVSGGAILCLLKIIPEKYRKIAISWGTTLLLTGVTGGLSGVFYLVAHDLHANNSNPAIAIPLKKVNIYCSMGGALTGILGSLFYWSNQARKKYKHQHTQVHPGLAL